MMQKIVEATSQRAARDKRRIQTLERALRTGGLANTVGATAQATTVDANTVVTIVDIGGNPVLVSFGHLFQKMREMEAKVEVLTKQANNVGVLFGRWGFPSEAEFTLFMARKNPGSTGLAAFVDITYICFFFANSSTTDANKFLNTAHRAKSAGLKGGEAEFAVLFQVRYSTIFVGTTKGDILTTTVIHIFKSYEDWKGNGHAGDRIKDRLAQMMAQAVACHKQYVEDAGFTGKLKELALMTADETSRWWHELVNYVDREFLTLSGYNLSPKNILLLIKSICHDP